MIEVNNITIDRACATLIKSVAGDDANIYNNPITQMDAVKRFPAWWIVHSSNSFTREPAGLVWINHEIELVYVYSNLQTNPRLFDIYNDMATRLLENCRTLTFDNAGGETDEEGVWHERPATETAAVHTFEPNYSIEREAMRFRFSLKLRATDHTVGIRRLSPRLRNATIKGSENDGDHRL